MRRSRALPNFVDPLRFCRPPQRTQNERHALIAKAAYLRAQARGCVPGHELQDWLAAEHDARWLHSRSFTRLEASGLRELWTALTVTILSLGVPIGAMRVAVIDHGRYLVIWRRVDGVWRIRRDTFSSSGAPKS
jgi:Protein of unknown function (DUF2934)